MSLKKSCWIITNGNAGTLNQALGLAEQMNLNITIKTVQRYFPFSLIPPIFKKLGQWSIKFITKDSAKLIPPWPDVVIACGSQSVHFCLYVKKASKGKTFTIFLQDPRISAKNFDLVIKMKHDSIQGDNVIESNLSLNRITREKLDKESNKYIAIFKNYKKPFFTFLLGGSTKRYKMTDEACKDIIKKINTVIKESPEATLLITPSRRTPQYLMDLLNKHFKQNKKVYTLNLHSKTNPFFTMLAKAEKIFVTNDSVNMISEACSTTKPVCIIKLKGMTKGKPLTFANNVINDKLAYSFENRKTATKTSISTLNETQNIAKQVVNIMNKS